MNKPVWLQWEFLKPGNWIFWIVLSLILKSSLFIYKINEHTEFPNVNYTSTFAREGGDAPSYIDPIEHLINTGTYKSEIVFQYIGSAIGYGDYRMPGYSSVYFILRQIFNTTEAINSLVILQLFFSSVSVYVLALIALEIFKTNSHFYITFLLYVTSSFVSLYDHVIATESFSAAGLILSLYFLVKPGNSPVNLLISGAFMTWCIFLRPVTAPLLILFSIYIVFRNFSTVQKFKIADLKYMLVFLVPFVIIDSCWVVRNYKVHNGFYPLTTSIFYPGIDNSVLGSVYTFLQSYGGSIVGWNSNSEINYFVPGIKDGNVAFPDHIFNEKFNIDSLAAVKKLVIQIEDPVTPATIKLVKQEQAREMLNRYAASIRHDRPFLYYVSSRIKYFKSFFIHSGTGGLFEKPGSELPIPALLLKLYNSALYWFVVVFGFAGCLIFTNMKNRNIRYLLLAAICVYLAFVFPLILKFDEWRYFVPGYPFFLLASVFVTINLIHLVKNRKLQHV